MESPASPPPREHARRRRGDTSSSTPTSPPPPCFIRLCVKRPLVLYLLFLALPVTFGLLLVPNLTLTDPMVGWRVRNDPTAANLDAVILATRQMGIATNDPPPSPPAPLPPPTLDGRRLAADITNATAENPRRQRFGQLVLVFESANSNETILTTELLAEVERIEAAVLDRLGSTNLCLLQDAHSNHSSSCMPAVSVTSHVPNESEVAQCIANHTNGSFVPTYRACMVDRLAWSVRHSEAIESSIMANDGAGAAYWELSTHSTLPPVTEASRTQVVLGQLASALDAGGARGRAVQATLTQLVLASQGQDDLANALGESLLNDLARMSLGLNPWAAVYPARMICVSRIRPRRARLYAATHADILWIGRTVQCHHQRGRKPAGPAPIPS